MKKEYIIILFILLGPILDVLSFLGLQVSVIIRGLFLSFSIIYILVNRNSLKIIIPLLVFSLISFIFQIVYLKLGLVISISNILKFLYLPVLIVYFKDFKFSLSKERILTITLFIYVVIYLLSFIFNLGESAYLDTDGKSGFKGVFNSINEFSAIVVGLLPIAVFYLKENKKYILMFLIITLSIVSSLLIGTKVLLGGIIFTLIYLICSERKLLFFDRSRVQKLIILISSLIVVVSSVFLFMNTRTYKNMMIQQEFFQVDNVFSYDFLNRVIYNDRLTFLDESFDSFSDNSIQKVLLGKGNNNIEKMVEIDFFDILFIYGVLGLVIFIYSIVLSIDYKKITLLNKISAILFLLISLTSGHVLIYPAVCIFLALVLSPNKEGSRKAK